MIDDPVLERDVAMVFAETAPSRPPDHLLPNVLTAASRRRQRPPWLVLIKERPMRVSSHVAVGSPTARLAAILAATLLIAALGAGAIVAGATYLAGSGSIVVAQDGSGTYATITEAVAAAVDGEVIIVRPGRYAEHIVIDKDITLEGEGPREAIVIPYAEDSPTATSYWQAQLPNAITLEDADVTLRHLSIEGLEYGIGIAVNGGDVLLEDLSIVLPGEYHDRPGGGGRWAIHLADDATGTVRESTIRGYIAVVDGAAPIIEGVELIQDTVWLDDSGAATVVRGNKAMPSFYSQGNPLGTVTDNEIAGSVILAGDLDLVGNTLGLDGNTEGVIVASGSPHVARNSIVGKSAGIEVGFGTSPVIEDNTISENTIGILVDAPASDLLSVTGNTFCGNGTNLQVPDGSNVAMDDNVICEAG